MLSEPTRETSFGALVAASVDDSRAARGLAYAYAELPRDARRRLVDAVMTDSARESIAAAVPLALLLSVESDPANIEYLFRSLAQVELGALESQTPPRGYLGQSESGFVAVVMRPLYAGYVELFGVRANVLGEVEARLQDPLVSLSEADSLVANLAQGIDIAEVTYGRALDEVAKAAWAHRRLRGSMPDGCERLAALC